MNKYISVGLALTLILVFAVFLTNNKPYDLEGNEVVTQPNPDIVNPDDNIIIPEQPVVTTPEAITILNLEDFNENEILDLKHRFLTYDVYLDMTGTLDEQTVSVVSELKIKLNDDSLGSELKSTTLDAFVEATDNKFANVSHEYLMLTNKNLSLWHDYAPKSITKVNVTANKETYLDENAAKATEAMFEKAKADGIKLVLISGYRDFFYQEGLFQRKVNQIGFVEANKIVAQPGESEHQTGFVIDISCDSIGWKLQDNFDATKEYAWLKENAPDFGFILRYPKHKVDVTDYSYEPWHYRYIGDAEIANFIMDNDLTLEEYHEQYLNT